MDCIFCKIATGQIKARSILETENSMAFLDAFPLAKGHTLVIPKKHYEKVQDVPAVENADLFDAVHTTISQVDKISGATLVAIHNGRDAGQEIPHVHVHIIPRCSEDSASAVHSMFKTRPKISEEDFDKIQKQLAL